MPNRRPPEPASKIKAFIDEHRDADLVVCTGNASVKGLAWLARQIKDSRNVTLVIGDMTEHLFKKSKDEDRDDVALFLTRENVKVHNWYRSKPVKKIAHGKAVVARRGGEAVAALIGSANLTGTGLFDNLEMMVRCDPADLPDIDAYIDEATSHQPATDKLIGFVARDKKQPAVFVAPSKKQPAASKGGCLPALALIPVYTAGSFWSRFRLSAIFRR